MKNILIIILLVIGLGFIYNSYNSNNMQGINNSIVKACGYDMSKGMISECD